MIFLRITPIRAEIKYMKRMNLGLALCIMSLPALGYTEDTAVGLKKTQTRHIQVFDTNVEIGSQDSPIYVASVNDQLDITVTNQTPTPLTLHWHGLIVPWDQDGTPYLSQSPIAPGKSYRYTFPLLQTGTFYAHGQYGLEQQNLMSIPIVINEKKELCGSTDIVMFLEDFTSQKLDDVLKALRKEDTPFNMEANLISHCWNDICLDSYLTNRKTWENPDVYQVKSSETIRLRLINAACATDFLVHFGSLQAKVIAADGSKVVPLRVTQLPITMGQRYDVMITVPSKESDFPIIAQAVGTNQSTGLILTSNNVETPSVCLDDIPDAKEISNDIEMLLHPLDPLPPKKVDRQLRLEINGNKKTYKWSINNKPWLQCGPLRVKEGERVELVVHNKTNTAHPIHLHGHTFQVIGINNQRFQGPMRDTLLVMPGQIITVYFDANNPGVWLIDCKHIYRAWQGMATVLEYEGFEKIQFSPLRNIQYSMLYD